MPDEEYLVAEQATTGLSVVKWNLTGASFLTTRWTKNDKTENTTNSYDW